MRMDRAQKERKKWVKRQALHSLGDALLAVIGRSVKKHISESARMRVCLRYTFLGGKVGQDKLRAYIHAEQHPRTLLWLCVYFSLSLSISLSLSLLPPPSHPSPSLHYILSFLSFSIPPLFLSLSESLPRYPFAHFEHPSRPSSPERLSPLSSLWSASPSSSRPPISPTAKNIHHCFISVLNLVTKSRIC